MESSKFKAFWDFISLSGGELISKIAGFIAFAYLARVLEPSAYGSVEFAVSLLVFFSLIVDFGYGPVGARDISQHREHTQRYAAAIPSARIILAIFSLIFMCSLVLFLDHDKQTRQLVWIFSLALLATPFNQRWLLQGLDKMQLVSLGQIVRMSVFATGVILLIHSTSDLLKIGYIEISASLLMAIYFLAAQHKLGVKIRLSKDLRFIFTLSTQAMSIGLSQIIWAFNQYLPTILVASIAGTVQVAWFGAAHRIVMSAVSFSLIYHFNLFPMLSKRLKNSHQDYLTLVNPSFTVTAWAGIGAALAVTLFAEPISIFIFGDKFTTAATPLAILIWVLPVTLLSGHARWTLIASHNQRFALYAQVAGTSTIIAFSLLLINDYGATGASIAMLACAITVWVVQYYFVVKLVGAMPFITSALKPLLLAFICIISARFYSDQVNLMPALAFIVYIGCARLLERNLFVDAHSLMKIKHEPVS